MERFLSLCTSLRKPRLARDALGLYRIAAQSVSVTSVEKIINKFIVGSEERLAKAQQEAKAILGEESTSEAKKDDVEDDLELPLQPETLLIDSLVEEDGTAEDKDRVERSVVNPWMRFCWEAYKSCLDVCKSNQRLEVVYQVSFLRTFFPFDNTYPASSPAYCPASVQLLQDPRPTQRVPTIVRADPKRASKRSEILEPDLCHQLCRCRHPDSTPRPSVHPVGQLYRTRTLARGFPNR